MVLVEGSVLDGLVTMKLHREKMCSYIRDGKKSISIGCVLKDVPIPSA